MARKHGDHSHERAEQDHLEAAAAHRAARAKPLNERLAGAAMRASSPADESVAEGGRAAV
jgi:hypothetical protein